MVVSVRLMYQDEEGDQRRRISSLSTESGAGGYMITDQNNKTYILDEGFQFFRSLSMRGVLIDIVLCQLGQGIRKELERRIVI